MYSEFLKVVREGFNKKEYYYQFSFEVYNKYREWFNMRFPEDLGWEQDFDEEAEDVIFKNEYHDNYVVEMGNYHFSRSDYLDLKESIHSDFSHEMGWKYDVNYSMGFIDFVIVYKD